MNKLTKSLLVGVFLGNIAVSVSNASCTGSSPTWQTTPDQSSVSTCISKASEGDTVNISSGSASWTSGMSISGKGIILQGAGGGRVIAVDVENNAISLGTGTATFSNVTNDMGATAYLNATPPPINVGETLLIYENGFLANYMEGTVTSFNGSTLVMNITGAGGACGTQVPNAMNSNCKRWLITTLPSTTLINNLPSGAMINVTEDTSVHTTITGIQFAQGNGGGGQASSIYVTHNSGGQAVLIHDNFFESNQADIIDGDSNRGVIWNNSFVFSPFSEGQWAGIRIKDPNNSILSTSWSTAALWGSNDTTGQGALYFETNDVHADGDFTDFDDDARAVFRYNVLDNAGNATHGADTSYVGQRYFEFYNNVGIFEAYNDGSTANMNWWMFVRGGTFVWHDNTLPQISSTDWGTKPDMTLTVMTLQREDNYPCWGAGFSTAGQYYYAPRQVGMGYVTGKGTVTYPPLGYTNASTTTIGISNPAYVGDSEPIYIWNNNRTMNVGIEDYGLGNGSNSCPSSPAPDSSNNYIVSGRDYFNGTAKPGYTPYTYPNPLTQSDPPPPSAPTGLTAVVQ